MLAAQSFAERRFEASSVAYNLSHSDRRESGEWQENIELKKALSARSYKLYKKLIRPYEKVRYRKKKDP